MEDLSLIGSWQRVPHPQQKGFHFIGGEMMLTFTTCKNSLMSLTDIVSFNIQETLGYRCYYYFHLTKLKMTSKLGKMAQLLVADPKPKAIWFQNPLPNCHPRRCQERALENAYSSGYSSRTEN